MPSIPMVTAFPQVRLMDLALSVHTHGSCPVCIMTGQHTTTGPAIQGSTNVFVNKLPAVRVGDMGISAICCQGSKWEAFTGSSSVFINKKAAFRSLKDNSKHCDNPAFLGKVLNGSSNVFVGG